MSSSTAAEVIKDVSQKFQMLFTQEAIDKVRAFPLKETDFVICGPPKSAVQIMHGFRTGGSMDFQEVGREVPVLEFMLRDKTAQYTSDQNYPSKIYKCHLRYDLAPKGPVKHVIMIRNPADAALSSYYFHEGMLYDKKNLSIGDFVEALYVSKTLPEVLKQGLRGTDFIAKAYPHRNERNVLWLHYEDLKEDLKSCVKMVSDFMEIGIGEGKLLDLIEHQSTFEFMKQNDQKFGTSYVMRMPEGFVVGDGTGPGPRIGRKIRKGAVNDGKKEIPLEQQKALAAQWNEIVQPICGYESYDAMRLGINKEMKRPFGQEQSQKEEKENGSENTKVGCACCRQM